MGVLVLKCGEFYTMVTLFIWYVSAPKHGLLKSDLMMFCISHQWQ